MKENNERNSQFAVFSEQLIIISVLILSLETRSDHQPDLLRLFDEHLRCGVVGVGESLETT
jgi:hypothetical protein